MHEQEIISKLKTLKEIKPNTEWVVLQKRQILGHTAPVVQQPVQRATFSHILSVFSLRPVVYGLVALMVVFIGASGVLEYKLSSDVRVANQSAANLLAMKDNIETLKANAQTLKNAVATNNTVNETSAAQHIKSAAKNLAQAVQKNPQLARQVAIELNNNKTLLDVNGDAEVHDMYKEVATALYNDYQKNKNNLTP